MVVIFDGFKAEFNGLSVFRVEFIYAIAGKSKTLLIRCDLTGF